MEFEWNEAKAELNLRKHGLDFVDIVQVFDGRAMMVTRSDRSGEMRFLGTTLLNGRHVTAVWTERSGRIRVISLRRARVDEQRAYRDLHGG